MNDIETEGWRRALKTKVCARADFPVNIQNVHTPFDLCKEMIGKIPSLNGKILVLNLEFVEVLCYDYGVPKENVWFVTDCKEKNALLMNHPRYKGVHGLLGYYLSDWKTNMKFDVIVGNPPYQAPQSREEKSSGRSGTTLWDKFVVKSAELLKEGGYLCYVHPSSWRGFGKTTQEARIILKNNQIDYLELHDEKDGLNVFGAETRYDWYVMQKKSSTKPTMIVGQDGKVTYLDLTKVSFIPNGMVDEVYSLMAKEGEEKVSIIYNRSSYGTDKEWMSDTQKGKFQFPCVYAISKDGNPTFWYCNTKTNGHFGIPKVIFASGRISSANYIVDTNGKYGLTQFARGISDSPENLPKIAVAMRTDKFKRIMEMCAVGTLEINRDVLATFRKDFWKHFVDENGNELP